MLVLDIQPYIGALPLRLGMSRQEVHAVLGSPWRSMPGRNHTGSSDYWLQAKINVGLTRDGIVNHIGLSPGSYVLSVQGQVLWSSTAHPDPNPALLRLDPRPVTTLGFLVFTALGVTTTGFAAGVSVGAVFTR